MNYSRLGRLGIGLALVGWLAIVALRIVLFQQSFSLPALLLELGLLLLGALWFWRRIAQHLDRVDRKLRSDAQRLAALHRAGLAITTEQDLETVLQTVVDQSRSLLGARYGALGVLNPDGNGIESFIVSGISPDIEAQMAPTPPRGHGILGLPIQQRRAIRVDDIASHPASVGFPPHHPPMTTFLGVPISSKGKTFGNLYLTDKLPHPDHAPTAPTATSSPATHPPTSTEYDKPIPFTEDDQTLLEMFATQAAIAIENALLHRQTRELAILRERERFGMDLHDGVIQSIYAIGLTLDASLHQIEHDLPAAKHQVRQSALRLNEVIADIRRYIHDLRTHSSQTGEPDNPVAELENLAQTLRKESALDVRLTVDAAILRRMTPRQNTELLQIVREATTNILRHAHATRAEITLQNQAGQTLLEIRDNGRGFDLAQKQSASGQGLGNIRRRAAALTGELSFHSEPGHGTRLRITIPH